MDAQLLTRVIEEAAASRENAVTEVFATLLAERVVCAAFLQKTLTLEARHETVSILRQYENQNADGYPDLALLDSGLLVLVECKLNAGLTPIQPQEYAKELSAWSMQNPAGVACLAILAPERRVPPLMAECCARLGCGPATASLAGGVRLRIISWRQVAATFTELPLEGATAFVRDNFCELVSFVEAQASRCLTEETLAMLTDSQVLTAVAALEDCLHELLVLAKRSEYTVRPKLEYDCQGCYVSPPSHPERSIWVGVSHRTGAALGVVPLFVQLVGAAFGEPELRRLRAAGFLPIAPTEPDWLSRPIISLRVRSNLDPPLQAAQLWAQVTDILTAAIEA